MKLRDILKHAIMSEIEAITDDGCGRLPVKPVEFLYSKRNLGNE